MTAKHTPISDILTYGHMQLLSEIADLMSRMKREEVPECWLMETEEEVVAPLEVKA